MIKLHAHQETMVAETRAALRSCKSVILRSPTGSGKTICAAFIIQAALAKGSDVIFTVHRRELLKQSSEAFDLCGIEHGIIAAGHRPNPLCSVQIASIDTLKRRLEDTPPPSLLIIDECHHAASEGWGKVLKFYQSSHIVGLTATPWRLDGKGLGTLFGKIVHGPETKWLIENKFLAPFRAFAPPSPDMAGVHTVAGDYALDEIEERMDKPNITGDAVAHYRRVCPGMRAIAFTTTVKHSQHVAEAFNADGIPALHIDGTTPTAQRDAAIQAFRDERIKVLTNCNIISEGFDVPAMDAAILLRPTKSLSLYLQQVGRTLRYVEGKTAIILDHAGNIATHGLPTDVFDWSLEGRAKGKKNKSEVPVKMCPECFFAHHPAELRCPSCGHIYETKERKVAYVDADLHEINQDSWVHVLPYKKMLKRARTREELMAVAHARKYKPGWVYRIMQEREKHERSRSDAARTAGSQ